MCLLFLTKKQIMKKLFLVMVITTISMFSFAQFGVQAGATIATIKESSSSTSGSVSSSSKVGFTLGIVDNIPLSPNFWFRPELNFTQKGGQATDTYSTIKDEMKLTLNYLEVPLNFVYRASGFFVGAGPVLSYGISGKSKETISGAPSGNGTTVNDVKFGSGVDKVKPFEFSANILAGYLLASGISFSANYNFGLSNLSNDNSGKLKNSYFGIRVGKTFGSMNSK